MIDHVGCTVKNLDKSCKFYMRLFGLKVIRQWERKDEGMSSRTLGTESGGMIELIESRHATLPNKSKRNSFVAVVNQPGFTHMAFEVKDMRATITKLVRLGGKLIDGPMPGKTVKSFAYAQDPDGIVIELLELK